MPVVEIQGVLTWTLSREVISLISTQKGDTDHQFALFLVDRHLVYNL